MSVQKINESNFEQVKSQSGVVLLDFYADWCGPCRMMGPIVEEVAQARPDVLVGKINVDEEPALAAAFGVVSIPTLVVMKEGKVLQSSPGARPRAQVLAMLDA